MNLLIGILLGVMLGGAAVRGFYVGDKVDVEEKLDKELKDEVVRLRKQVADLIGKE